MSKIEKHDKNTIDYYMVRRDLELLKGKKGYHTELISLYIPPNRPLSMVSNYLKNELSESSNIKSKTTRKNVTDAITSLIAKLKVLDNTPNGLVLFDGFIPVHGPGTEREESYVIIPPEPVSSFKYHCAAEFFLDPLEDMLKDRSTYGLISISRNETAIGTLRGTHVDIITVLTSGIHGKHTAGGQSQRRFERLIEEAAREFYKRCGDNANQIFSEISDLEGIILGGPGFTKDEFIEGPFLRDEFKVKVLKPHVDTDGGGEYGMRTLLFKAQDILKETEFMKEKLLIEKFMGHIARDSGMVVYGLHETLDALKNSAVELLLLSDELKKTYISRACNGCAKVDEYFVPADEAEHKIEDLTSGECPDCSTGYVNAKILTRDLVEHFGVIAGQVATEVRMVSTDIEEGKMFKTTFGGIGGFLRYKYNY